MTHTKQNAASGDTASRGSHSHKSPAIIPPVAPDCKVYETAQARAALKGFTLRRAHRAEDSRVTFLLANWLHTRAFTHWHDVESFLASIEGVNHE